MCTPQGKVLQKCNDVRGAQAELAEFGLFWLVSYSVCAFCQKFRHLHIRTGWNFLESLWGRALPSRAAKGPSVPMSCSTQSEPRDTQQSNSASPPWSVTVSRLHLLSRKVEFFPSLIIQCNIHFLSPHEPRIPMCSNKLQKLAGQVLQKAQAFNVSCFNNLH